MEVREFNGIMLRHAALTIYKPDFKDPVTLRAWFDELGHLDPIALNEALHAIRKAIALNPNAATYHRSLGDLYQTSADPKAAIDAYQQALKLDAGNTDTLLNLLR